MDDFEFTLWIFDPNFIPSVMLMVMTLFVVSFTFTKIATSRRVQRLADGPDPDEVRHKAYCKSLVGMMSEEIATLRAGRKYSDLTEEDRQEMRDIRAQYFKELKGDSNERRQLNS